MMFSRGQSGKVLAAFPVMILVFVIMAGFVAGSFAIRAVKNPEVGAVVGFDTMNLLIEEVNIGGVDMLVFDAIVGFRNDEIGRNDFKSALEILVDGENGCLGILLRGARESAFGSGVNDLFFVSTNSEGKVSSYGSGGPGEEFPDKYKDSGMITKGVLSVDGDLIEIDSYVGECLGVELSIEGGTT